MENWKKVSCTSCGREWEITEKDYRDLKACPFCVSEYVFPDEEIIIDSFPNAILKVISSFGISILSEQSKFLSCLLDLAPEYRKEVKIVSRVCTRDIFSEMIRWPSANETTQTASIARMKTILAEEEGLSDEWAEKIIDGFAYAIIPSRRQQNELRTFVQQLNQQKIVPDVPKALQSNNEDAPVGNQNNAFLLFVNPTEPECVMAKKHLDDAGIPFDCIDVVKFPALADHFSAHLTPLLAVSTNGEEKQLQGIESIKKFCAEKDADYNKLPCEGKQSTSDPFLKTVDNVSLNKALHVEMAKEVLLAQNASIPASWTFRGKKDIDLVIVDGCTVSDELFNGCSNLKAVFISSCSRIGKNAFANCDSLRYVFFDGNIAPSLDLLAFDACPLKTLFVYKWGNMLTCKDACERLAKRPEQVMLYNPAADEDLACIVEYARERIGHKW